MIGELRKASWPTWLELKESTIVVLIAIGLLGAYVSIVDFSLFQVVNLFTNLVRQVFLSNFHLIKYMNARRTQPIQDFCWYTVRTLSNHEGKAKQYIENLMAAEKNEDIKEVLMPTETVTEVKHGKKNVKVKKLYPGYLFIHLKLYDEEHKIQQKPWSIITSAPGVRGFAGGDKPMPLKPAEIEHILLQIKEAEGVERPKVQFEVGSTVKITDGPFLNLTGTVDEIDPDKGKLKVSVSIFGRFTPVDLEYWQVERADS